MVKRPLTRSIASCASAAAAACPCSHFGCASFSEHQARFAPVDHLANSPSRLALRYGLKQKPGVVAQVGQDQPTACAARPPTRLMSSGRRILPVGVIGRVIHHD